MERVPKKPKLDESVDMKCNIHGVAEQTVEMPFGDQYCTDLVKYKEKIQEAFCIPPDKGKNLVLKFDCNEKIAITLEDKDWSWTSFEWPRESQRNKLLRLESLDDQQMDEARSIQDKHMKSFSTFEWHHDINIPHHQRAWQPDLRLFFVDNPETFKFKFSAPSESLFGKRKWQVWFEITDGSSVVPVEKERSDWESQDGIWKLQVEAGSTYERLVEIKVGSASLQTLSFQSNGPEVLSKKTQWEIKPENIREQTDIFKSIWSVKLQLVFHGLADTAIVLKDVGKNGNMLKQLIRTDDVLRLKGQSGILECRFRRISSYIIGLLHTFPNRPDADKFLEGTCHELIPVEPHLRLSADLRDGGIYTSAQKDYLCKLFEVAKSENDGIYAAKKDELIQLSIGEVKVNDEWSLYLVPSGHSKGRTEFFCYFHRKKVIDRIISRFYDKNGTLVDPFTLVLDLDGTVVDQTEIKEVRPDVEKNFRNIGWWIQQIGMWCRARPQWHFMRRTLLEERRWDVYIASRAQPENIRSIWEFLKLCDENGKNYGGQHRQDGAKAESIICEGLGFFKTYPNHEYQYKSLSKLGLKPEDRPFTVILDDRAYYKKNNWETKDWDDCGIQVSAWNPEPTQDPIRDEDTQLRRSTDYLYFGKKQFLANLHTVGCSVTQGSESFRSNCNFLMKSLKDLYVMHERSLRDNLQRPRSPSPEPF